LGYVGNSPAEKYASFAVQHFTTSATTTYSLTHAVANENDIRLVINNVVQQPGSSYAYTATGTTLTLSSATAGSDTMYCVFLGKAVQTVNPPAGSVGTSQLADDAVTTIKINDDAVNSDKLSSTAVDNTNTNSTLITAQTEKTTLVDADKFLISDSAASGAFKYVQKSNLPSGGLIHLSTISITSSTADATFLQGTNGVDINSGTYENFLIIGSGIQVGTDDDSIRVSFSIDNGSNYNAQTYRATDQVEMTQSGSTATASTGAQSVSGASSIAGAVGNNSGNTFMFTMFLFNLNSTTMKKTALVEALEEQHNLIYKKRSSFITIAEKTAAIDGIRFNCNAGTFSKATFRLYGITNG
jgi:hypothetical protein